jgi:hypothetical protein
MSFSMFVVYGARAFLEQRSQRSFTPMAGR